MTLTFSISPAFDWNFFSIAAKSPFKNSTPRQPKTPDHQARARRDLLSTLECDRGCIVEGEFGMQAMMAMYPRDF